jgi:class 3 adenylate cyclase/tetratricopeptide (TPR) repeat protein
VACANCGAGLPADAKFCLQCGQAIAAATPATYTPAHLKERIIAARRSMEAERKQVTVLFCDIVKSSALAAKLGAEGFHALVNRFFKVGLDAVHRYEGTVNQFMGDGFMALFGAPIAHEDHARRAALAAIEIRDRAEVDVRIGINSGGVVVGPIGDDLWVDYSAFGDTIVLAARLQAAAEPRQILMSNATAHSVRGYITFAATPEVRVKERSVQPVRVMGIGPRTSPLDLPEQPLSPFVGRDREITVLQEALRMASAAGGQIVGLVGEPGLGKSRVVLEFAREAAATATILEGRCLSFGSRFAYLPLLEIVGRICDLGVTDDDDTVEAKLRSSVALFGLDQQYIPFLLNGLNVPLRQSELKDLDRPTIKGQTFRAMRDLLIATAKRRPLVLVIEDLHWVDPTTGEFLALFSEEIETTPILLVGTFRPGYKPPWSDKSFARQEALYPLDATASEHIVRTILGTEGQSVSQIVARGEGNPFFLEELSRSVQDKVADEMPSVPHSVHDVLAARIDRLSEEHKRALQLAAVIGREFTLEVMDSVWDGQDEPAAHLQELKRLEFVREQLDAEQRTFMFKHALTQEVAYNGLLEAHRQRLHEAVGKALEQIYGDRAEEHAELLAHHFQRSANSERAVHYLLLANRRADRRNALDEAYEYYRAAKELLEKLPDTEANRRQRVKLFVEQTREYHFRFRNQEYYDLLTAHEPMVLSLGDESLLGAFYGQLGHRELAMLFDYKRVERTLQHALELCVRSGNARDAIFAEAVLVWPITLLGEYDRALAHREKARKLLESSYESFPIDVSHGGACLLHVARGDWTAALAEADAGIAIGRERSDITIISFNYWMKSHVQAEQGDWAGALESGQASLEASPTDYFRGFAQLMIARALCHTGQSEQGLPIQVGLIAMLERVRHLLGWLYFSPGLVEDLIAAGARDDAIALLDRIEDAAMRGPAPLFAGKCRRLRAELGCRPLSSVQAWTTCGGSALRTRSRGLS